jgi:diguanylate cyclase (GGDEF)-like protein
MPKSVFSKLCCVEKTVRCTVFFCLLFWLTPAVYAESFDEILTAADFHKSTDHSKSVQLLDKITHFEELSREQKAFYLYLKGYQAGFVGDFNAAIEHYNGVFNYSPDALMQYRTKISLANVYAIKRNVNKAMEYMVPALEQSESIQNAEHRHAGLFVAAVIYAQLGLYPEALEVVDKLLSDTPAIRTKCYSLSVWHEAKFYLGVEVAAEQLQNDADNCRNQKEMLPAVVMSRFAIYRALARKDYAQAKQLTETLLPEVEATKYTRYISEFIFLQASAEYGIGDMKNAERLLLKSLEMNNSSGNTKPVIESYLLLSKIQEQANNSKQALEYYKQYAAAERLYNEDISSQKLAYNLAKGQLFSKNQQIALLEKNNTLLELEQSLHSTEQSNARLLIALMVISLIAVGYFAVKTLRSKTKYRLLAENDTLTGISNRYHFTEKVRSSLEQSLKTAQIDSFIIFDLDFFKPINDLYGHLTGDWVLQTVVEHSRQFVRNLDVFGRIGGEEFAIYLPACTSEKAALLAEILRDAIAQIDYSGSGHPIRLTASFGVTSTDRSGYQLKQLFRDADQALYYSKEHGRNQVTLFKDFAGN